MKNKEIQNGLLICMLLLLPLISFAGQTVFYVAPNGSDANPGTQKQPFQTFTRAKAAVSKLIPSMAGDIIVYFSSGDYVFEDEVVFTPADGGKNNHRVIYRAYQDAKPVFTGATKVSGWKKFNSKVYQVHLDHPEKLRSLFINGKRAYMASQSVKVKEGWGTFEVKKGQADWAWIDGSTIDGVQIALHELPELTNKQDIEILRNTKFNSHILGIRDITSSQGHWVFKFQQPYGAMALHIKYGAYHPSGQQVVYNAFELLDEPGEFYFDRKNKILFYMPREGEDLETAEVYAPRHGSLITIQGKSKSERVHNLSFEGLTFAYTEAVLPEVGGSVGKSTVQAATFVRGFDEPNWHTTAYRAYDAMPSAINVSGAQHIQFKNNVFKHVGNEGIGFINDVTDSQFVGNLCYDIGGGAIQVGHPQHVYEGDSHDYARYSPEEEGVCRNILVENNVLYDMTTMFYGHAPITAYFVDGLKIVKNHIQKSNYSAVSVGWGWNNFDEISVPNNPTTTARNNVFSYNRVYDCMNMLHDGGAYYTLGSQPNSTSDGNYVKAATTHFQGVYHPDEGTAWYTGKDHVFEVRPDQDIFELNKWRNKHDNHYRNIYTTSKEMKLGAPNCTVTDIHVVPNADWPDEALSIIRAAGVEENYHHLLEVIPEIVFENGKRYDTKTQIVSLTTKASQHAAPISGSRYEAEQAQLSNRVKLDKHYSGFSGTAYMSGFYNKKGAKITFSVTAEEMGTYDVILRYAAGNKDCDNIGVYVNGEKSERLKIKSTGGWQVWENHAISVFLKSGKNTITFKTESKSENVVHMDFIQVLN
ncbi:carbohydrate-binding protein [Mariniflexile ostreae]|uniref:Carbohydrate-binding protein n=1 Tax=Mariniflexile ostreae TaxID=1520892 RepID=A0ABV5FD78_9FLAO